MSFLVRLISSIGSAKNFRTAAQKAAKGVQHAKSYAKNVQANHFSVAFDRANAGDVDEQVDVAERYYEGRGIQQSYKDAAVWFERAAGAGIARAQSALGMMNYLGRGVSKDPKAALVWTERAAAQGDESARSTRETIAKALTAEQAAEARAEAKAFRPRVWIGETSSGESGSSDPAA
jgi:TPR repeat protein